MFYLLTRQCLVSDKIFTPILKIPMATKKTATAAHKIRIIVKAFEHKLIDEAVTKIVTTAKDSGAIVV